MKVISFILFVLSFLLYLDSNAQLVKVFESDSLNIYTNKDNQDVKLSSSNLKFVSEFNDSVLVCYDNKKLFSKYLKPDSSIVSTDVDQTAPYIRLPFKNKKAKLKIVFLNERITIESTVITGYKFLYVYKHLKNITLYYRNSEISFY